MLKKYTKLYEWQEIRKAGGFNCCVCNGTDEITVDHIIPQMLIEQFFARDNKLRYYWLYDNEQNFRYVCKYCGDKKGSKLDFTEPLTKQLLLQILTLI